MSPAERANRNRRSSRRRGTSAKKAAQGGAPGAPGPRLRTVRETSAGGLVVDGLGGPPDKLCAALIGRTDRRGRLLWSLPKGHIERGETEQQTALREIKEETGLDVTLIDGFRTTDSYVWVRDRRSDIHKTVVYFLGTFCDQTPVPQESEIADISLMRYDEAMAAFQFDGVRRVLTEANEFLKQME